MAVAHSGTSPHVPTYEREGGIRVRLRMFRRSTHAAFRARSFCDHWRGERLARDSRQCRAVGPYMQLRSAKKALGHQLQHSVRDGSWRSWT